MSFESKPKVDVIGRLQNTQTGPGLVQWRYLHIRVQEFDLKIRENQRQKLLDLVHGEEATRTLGDPRSKRHVEVTKFATVSVKAGLLLTVFIKVSVILVCLKQDNMR